MLYIGAKVGSGKGRERPPLDIALDPLEGTTITRKAAQTRGRESRWRCRGFFEPAPDVY